MFEILVSDILRYSHLLAVAVGIGVAVETETYMIRRRRTKISRGMLAALDHRHRVIIAALGVMWVTGLALVALRTGFQLAAFSPKIWAKIVVVTLLTVNAIFVARIAMPVLASHMGRPLARLPRRAQSAIFSVAGISATSWLLALALGSSALLKVAPGPAFQTGLPLAYILGIIAANAAGRKLFSRPPIQNRAAQSAEPGLAARPTAPIAVEAGRPAPAAAPAPKPRALPPAPPVTIRASDLAIAFPQKLKRPPRMKPQPGQEMRTSESRRADLARIASEFGGKA